MDYKYTRQTQDGVSSGYGNRYRGQPALAFIRSDLKRVIATLKYLFKELEYQKRQISYLRVWSNKATARMDNIEDRIEDVPVHLPKETDKRDSGSDDDKEPDTPVSDSDGAYSEDVEEDVEVLSEESPHSRKEKVNDVVDI